jgi:hypothetical protein
LRDHRHSWSLVVAMAGGCGNCISLFLYGCYELLFNTLPYRCLLVIHIVASCHRLKFQDLCNADDKQETATTDVPSPRPFDEVTPRLS